ncbi:hypothetical protein Lgra_0249 [Legionella gratiana]|uniref:Uncharacterized protein n=1 Tax=Legionella gratiana TaxID=45066 RepID=A0A378JBS0_9GAMM|nr:hypothetical protein [Legionella gratiana]KTD15583.1 hypothetical protein Lgra_0249 [Legionella gratiana]STX45045.1 Uncharacterised protein [Legionella gratiana]
MYSRQFENEAKIKEKLSTLGVQGLSEVKIDEDVDQVVLTFECGATRRDNTEQISEIIKHLARSPNQQNLRVEPDKYNVNSLILSNFTKSSINQLTVIQPNDVKKISAKPIALDTGTTYVNARNHKSKTYKDISFQFNRRNTNSQEELDITVFADPQKKDTYVLPENAKQNKQFYIFRLLLPKYGQLKNTLAAIIPSNNINYPTEEKIEQENSNSLHSLYQGLKSKSDVAYDLGIVANPSILKIRQTGIDGQREYNDPQLSYEKRKITITGRDNITKAIQQLHSDGLISLNDVSNILNSNSSNNKSTTNEHLLTKEQLSQLKKLQDNLKKEIDSMIPYPNKDLKRAKYNALQDLEDAVKDPQEQRNLKEIIESIKETYLSPTDDTKSYDITSGKISSRVRDLFDDFCSNQEEKRNSFHRKL